MKFSPFWIVQISEMSESSRLRLYRTMKQSLRSIAGIARSSSILLAVYACNVARDFG